MTASFNEILLKSASGTSLIKPVPPTAMGWQAIQQLPDLLLQAGGGPVLIVADPALVSLQIIRPVLDILEQQQTIYTIYSDLLPEPTVKTAQNAIDFGRNGHFKLVIGFGGGSALDMAKLVAVFAHNAGPVSNYLNLGGTQKIEKRGLPRILIPTTSGTGAEVTNISVLALERTKDVIVHDYLLADAAIVDPAFTLSVPPGVTAATGADALTHAIEAFISVNANPYSDGLALQAIRLISSSLRTAVKTGSSREARTAMAYGSYLAGMAFFNAGVGAIHALAYPLGGQFHLAHGASNAVLIPYVLGYIAPSCAERLAVIYQALGSPAADLDINEAAGKCIEALAALTKDIGIPETLAGYRIPRAAIGVLAADGFLQKRLLARCPMELSEQQIREIYTDAFTGTHRY
ncbi:iron-containing alcohol dehydrogenase [Niabella drilacis]|uniref:Alcohol dehydrogenase, class IV n=1 Tax=Niabella drilacis (strain DSM 25811 / CCM 8410 / CCUG 62505 / LMG 26954 / E90) TaxID=1285928 RepID=A0A1G6LTI4_NIADE|nr:iron-containing alcohol dehydrogenase [Niabella drilacis]SDC46608.1 Alcohol dehydrogenase, class IV [Niabella drilacis]